MTVNISKLTINIETQINRENGEKLESHWFKYLRNVIMNLYTKWAIYTTEGGDFKTPHFPMHPSKLSKLPPK